MLMAKQTVVSPRLEGIVLVATGAKGLVRLGPLLEWEITQAWTITKGSIDASLNLPFNLNVPIPTNDSLFLGKHYQFVFELPTAFSHRMQ